jgi:hypothetical protein
MASDSILVRRPTAAPAGEASAPSFTLGRPLPGLRVGLRTDRAWRSWQLISTVWAGYLERDGATTESVETGAQMGEIGAHDRKHIDELASTVDGAIVGLGTCGSCTTYTVKDSVTIEQHGKPVVALVCEEFLVHAQNVARHLGHGDLKVLVLPYPLEARPEAELRAIADEYYPQVLDLLGVSQ